MDLRVLSVLEGRKVQSLLRSDGDICSRRPPAPIYPSLFGNSVLLRKVAVAVAGRDGKTLKKEKSGVLRQCAELPFVPSARYEHKGAQPFRHVGVRLVKP